jgi:hypothetical protein
MKPNLFSFATSELSQDAVLCWLAAWADPDVAHLDPILHNLGKSFLNLVFRNRGIQLSDSIKRLQNKRQYKKIDVLIIVDDLFAVLIEDKAGTTEHSNQLIRYRSLLRKEGFAEEHIRPVYIQTGEQSNYRSVEEAGYQIVCRWQLIALLQDYLKQGGSDSVARDFYDHLVGIESDVHAFRTLQLSQWSSYAWQGFYSEVQRVLDKGEWGKVANPSGGFLGFWWNFHSDGDCKQYFQLEQKALCFKIEAREGANRSELRSHWMTRLLATSRDLKFPAIKPKRLGLGQTMTVAVFDGEYRVTNKDGTLDFEGSARVLSAAAEVLDGATAASNYKAAAA